VLIDPLPTWLLKNNVDLLAPFLCQLFNWSLEHGAVPSSMKAAYITPIVKKANMDPTDPKSYRPISNLSVVSKLLERLVCQQLVSYLKTNSLLPDLQSAFRAHHSTETAVLKVMSDILLALDSGNLALLTLLDLSAAFDSVDHATLLRRLQKSMVSVGLFLTGSRRTSVDVFNMSVRPRPVPSRLQCCMEYLKARSLDLSCFYSTLQTCCS